MAMLCFDLRRLDVGPIAVDGRLDADDSVWSDQDTRPQGQVHLSGRLSPAGGGRYYFSGTFEGTVGGECRLCLSPLEVPVSGTAQLVFAESGDDEVLDDPDVFLLDSHAGELDMRAAVREQWLLAAPAFVQCREDCRGLCPNCGVDLNTGDCNCPPSLDGRWDALRAPRDSHV